MRKIELLAPAGTKEALKAAVKSGANAVYLGGKKFGARKNAANFDNQQLIEAINYCHTYEVKVYVTVNTVVFESEVDELKEYIKFLVSINVDAIIVQDFGVLKLVREISSDIEIHASTQMKILDVEGAMLAKKLGVSRIVIGRECSLDTIKQIVNKCEIEVEAFVHGALCVSVSGGCLMSSFIGGRSGNRGNCAQPCRKKYKIEKHDDYKYMLSTKDLCTIEHIPSLIKSGIHSFKIEGRMKNPEYISTVVKEYRNMIDSFFADNQTIINKKESIKALELAYNRQFTKGFINDSSKSSIINTKRAKNYGLNIGTIEQVKDNRILINTNNQLHEGDRIIVLGEKDLNIEVTQSKQKTDSQVWITTKQSNFELSKIQKTQAVYKIFDKKISDEVKQLKNPQTDVYAHLVAKEGCKLKINLYDTQNNYVEYESDFVIQKAKNKGVSEEEIISQIKKTGNEPFKFENVSIELDSDVFVAKGAINNIRRESFAKLLKIRQNVKVVKTAEKTESTEFERAKNSALLNKIFVNVKTKNQLNQVLKYNEFEVIVDEQSPLLNDQIKEKVLVKLQSGLVENKNLPDAKAYVVTGLSGLGRAIKSNKKIIVHTDMNITNTRAIDLVKSYGIDIIGISPETSKKEMRKLNHTNSELMYSIYGNQHVMTTKACLYSACSSLQCHKCPNLGVSYHIEDELGVKFPVTLDYSGITNVYNSKKTFLLLELTQLKNLGINNFLINLTDETSSQTIEILESLMKIINDDDDTLAKTLQEKLKSKNNLTNGRFIKGLS